MKKSIIVPVILCGGSGTRLWPASREDRPKQFLSLMDDFSLLQNTMKRALRTAGAQADHIVTVTLGSLSEQVAEHLSALDPAAAQHILCEPSARNTAAAVALAAAYVQENFGEDAMMWVLPADHHIGDENALAMAFRHALKAAEDGYLVTFGIQPTRPDTGYGYILLGDKFSDGEIFQAARFVEKPNRDIAQTYLDAGNYMWNSGMFLFSAGVVLEQYSTHADDVLSAVQESLKAASVPREPDPALYAVIPKCPFDVAIMEKSAKVAIVPCNPAWSDIGSWESLWEIRNKDMNGNVIEGLAACFDTKNCLIQSESRLIACAGLENIVVIESGDALLIADRSNADAMRVLVGGLKKSGYADAMKAPARPQSWSMTKTLHEPSSYNVRELAIKPGQTMRLVQHGSSQKILTVIEGQARIVMNDKETVLAQQETIFIPSGAHYSIENMTNGFLNMLDVMQGEHTSVTIDTIVSRKLAA